MKDHTISCRAQAEREKVERIRKSRVQAEEERVKQEAAKAAQAAAEIEARSPKIQIATPAA